MQYLLFVDISQDSGTPKPYLRIHHRRSTTVSLETNLSFAWLIQLIIRVKTPHCLILKDGAYNGESSYQSSGVLSFSCNATLFLLPLARSKWDELDDTYISQETVSS